MFGKKLILIAATAALALGSISAKDASTVHVRVHSNDKSVCTGAGQSPMSVEGVEGVFCVTGQACVANISNGACPAAQTGLPNGSHCGVVKTGVYGCKPGPAPSNPAPKCDGPGQSPMSVEGAGTYCVTGQACVANISNGACPGPQAGIPYGSYCGKVKTGVYGCIPKKSATEGGNSTVVVVIDVEEDDSSDEVVPVQISEEDDSDDDSTDSTDDNTDSEDDSTEEAADSDDSE